MIIRSGLRLRLLTGGALLALNAAPAIAATPVATPEPAAAAAEDSGLADIIVTATKRETNLQSTPISISVLSAQSITDRHIQSLVNLMDGGIPSLRIATFEARQSALTVGIRGIVPYDANQTARDNGVSVYLDGVALGKTQGLNASLFDIERIEVLKGPQGTLFGRNTEGGAVSLVSKAPTGELDGRVVGGVGNYGSREVELHLDLPTYYNISLKFDGVYQHQDPTTQDPLTGSVGFNAYDRKGGRVQARWKPVEGLTADLAYDYTQDQNTPFFSQLLSYNPNNYRVGTYTNPTTGVVGTQLYVPGAAVPTTCGGTNTNICIAPKAPITVVHPQFQNVAEVGVPQQYSEDVTHGFSANLKYKIAPALELRSITAWRGVRTDQFDNSGGEKRVTFVPNGNFSRYSLSFLRQNQFSQEVQAVGSVPQLDYVVGAYYFTERASEYAATPTTNTYNADGTAFTLRSPIVTGVITSGNSGPQLSAPSCLNTASFAPNLCQFITRDSRATDHNISVFGQGTFTPSGLDFAHLTIGGRWTQDIRSGTLFFINGRDTNFTFRNKVSRFDPLVNLAIDASADIHFYAKYATGFRAGGANDRSQQFNAFGPESVKSYEVGAKMDFLDHKARLNLAGYIMDRSNTQFDFDLFDTAAGSPTANSHLEQTTNAGNTKIRGIEADLTVQPVRNLTLGASYAYTYLKAPLAVNPILGGPLQQLYIVYTPTNAASATLDYALPVGSSSAMLRLHLDANYSSSYNSFQLEPTRTDSSFLVNGRLALADIAVRGGNSVTVAIWSRNMFNEHHIYRRSAANSSPVLNYCGANGVNGATNPATPCTANALISTNYGGVVGDYGNFNPPRTFGLQISAKF